jgi:hypothetical protein
MNRAEGNRDTDMALRSTRLGWPLNPIGSALSSLVWVASHSSASCPAQKLVALQRNCA